MGKGFCLHRSFFYFIKSQNLKKNYAANSKRVFEYFFSECDSKTMLCTNF